jgi:hypothetical protein
MSQTVTIFFPTILHVGVDVWCINSPKCLSNMYSLCAILMELSTFSDEIGPSRVKTVAFRLFQTGVNKRNVFVCLHNLTIGRMNI